MCAFTYFSGSEGTVDELVAPAGCADVNLNVIDHGCGLDWFRAAICQGACARNCCLRSSP